MKKSKLATALLVAVAALGSATITAVPANAVGSGSWNCAIYNTYNGKSTTSGSNFTAGGSQCGSAQISVGYTVSGGSAQYTAYRTAKDLVTVGNPGYPVFQGRHKMSNPAPAYNYPNNT